MDGGPPEPGWVRVADVVPAPRTIAESTIEHHGRIDNTSATQLLGDSKTVFSTCDHNCVVENRPISDPLGGLLQKRLFTEKGEKLLGICLP